MYITKLIHGCTGVGDLVSHSIGCGEPGEHYVFGDDRLWAKCVGEI